MSLLNSVINCSIINHMKVFFMMKKDKILTVGGGLNLRSFLNKKNKNFLVYFSIFKSIGGIK